jgi:ribosomal protein S12 methylthiotransferase
MVKEKNSKKITVGFVALGCPKNIVDSEKMLAKIAQAGLVLTADADNADVVVINTCGFIAPAKAEALDAIRQAVKRKREGAVKKVIVAGCLPQREGRRLFSEAEGIDAIMGLAQRDNIAHIIEKTLAGKKHADFLPGHYEGICDDRARLRITPTHFAYLRICEGCNRNCSFCTIPAIRGRHRSKPEELVLAEAAELVAAGTVELNIIAQDTSSYGRDLKPKTDLAELLTGLDKIPNLKWIRLLYLYPTGINERLIETVAASERIVHYFDIPIQHINDQILKKMHRPGTKEQICRLIERLRSKLPDCVLRTTLIVGFPGETEEQLCELLEFVKWAKFDHIGCFTFYPESGTPAGEMPGQISDNVKRQRREELMLAQQQIAFEKNRGRIGERIVCLLETIDGAGTGKGRFFGQAPEIDSVCLVEQCRSEPGDFLNVRVTGTRDYDLLVEQILY